MINPKQKITTFLMFFGDAEEAMNFYTSIFDRSEITSITRYGENEVGCEVGNEGKVLHATFSLNGQEFMCIDSIGHEFTFTPAISLYVTCDTEDEMNRYYVKLSQDGEILMPLSAYPFSEKFGWVSDKYGVSWQFILNKNP